MHVHAYTPFLPERREKCASVAAMDGRATARRQHSSSEKETWSVANINDTIPSKKESIILVGTRVSFNTFKRASWWTFEDNNNAKIEI